MSPHAKSLDIQTTVCVAYQNRLKRIRKAIDLESVLVEDIESSKCEIVLISELTVVGPEIPVSDHSAPQQIEISNVSEEDWDTARKRFKMIEPLLNMTGRKRADVERRAKEFGVDPTTLYRWINDYEPTETLESLLPKQQSEAKGQSRLPKLVEQLVKAAVNQYPAKLKTIHDVFTAVDRPCKRLGIASPSEGTIRNRIVALPARNVLGGRRGRKAVRDRFDPKPDHYEEAAHPLAVYQIDHLKLPTIVVDEKYRRPIGKPWGTFVIDVNSRVIPGFVLLLEAPGTMSVGLCLGHAILPKEAWLASRGIAASWPIWGTPRVIHADNAKEFRGNTLALAAENIRSRIEWRPVKTPEYGGHIERLCGTLRRELERLPGGQQRPGKGNEDQDVEAESCLTLRELEEWLAMHIANVYHKDMHDGIGMPPLAKYEEGILGNSETPGIGHPPRILDERWLRLLFTPYELRTIQQYGIQWDHVHYWHHALAPYIDTVDPKTNKSRLFVTRRDPRDISKIYVWIPELNDHLEIPYRTMARPAVNIWELRAAMEEIRRRGEAAVDEETIFCTIEQQRVLVLEAAAKTKTARRFAQRRVENERSVQETGVAKQEEGPQEVSPLDYDNVRSFEDDDVDSAS